jgi:cytochrome c2
MKINRPLNKGRVLAEDKRFGTIEAPLLQKQVLPIFTCMKLLPLFSTLQLFACGQPREQNLSATEQQQEGQQGSISIVGERLFKERCASCHKLNSKLVGPELSAYRDSAGQMKRVYKFNTPYHTDTTLLDWDLDSIGDYVTNYSRCSLPPPTNK